VTIPPAARRGNTLKRVEDFLTGSQGQNLAVTVLYVPHSLDIGTRVVHHGWIQVLLFFFGMTLKPRVERYESL
jgi:hypothetical protein